MTGDAPPRIHRRAVLGGVASGATALSGGCVTRARSLVNRSSADVVSLTVKTTVADADEAATRIARRLVTNMNDVGIDAEVVPMSDDELLRDVLVNHEFDCYVARHPAHDDPDFCRPLFHSVFADEPGWQNPLGFTNLDVDDLLDAQRRQRGAERRRTVADVCRDVGRNQPLCLVAYPDDVRAVRTDRFRGWHAYPLDSALGFLALRRVDRAPALDGTGSGNGSDDRNGSAGGQGTATGDGSTAGTDSASALRVTITDGRVTQNFNPIAVEFRNRGTFVDLLYDPLARRVDGDVTEWLATDWRWETGDRTAVTVALRDGQRWHDGTPLTAADAAFTYRFLADTSLGEGDVPVPAPRFRGRTSLVEDATAVDETTLRVTFGDTSPEVAVRALTVPVLPAHEWRPTSTGADIAGIGSFEGVTEALVWSNPEPVGSGPLRFERSIAGESLHLGRYDEHFLTEDSPLPGVAEAPSYDRLVARVAPSDAAAVELVAAGEADAVAASVNPEVVPRIGQHDALSLMVDRSRSFYHVGFNCRREPLGNPHFRRAVSALVDDAAVVEDVFGGYATPGAVPLAGTEWLPSDLRWNGDDPVVPFAGSDGALDVSAARDLFARAGYETDDDGRLVDR